MRPLTLGLLGAGAAALLLATLQRSYGPGVYEYQQFRPYTGQLLDSPYPAILSGQTAIPLVAPGKYGAGSLFQGMNGAAISFDAERIQREDVTMLQVLPGSIRRGTGSSTRPPATPVGSYTLAGEIVDSKCFLGVMNPGSGHVHRECAVRCISGGVPPIFVVRDRDGRTQMLWLTGPEGQPLSKEVLDVVAEPVRIPGQLLRQVNLLYFRIDPQQIRQE